MFFKLLNHLGHIGFVEISVTVPSVHFLKNEMCVGGGGGLKKEARQEKETVYFTKWMRCTRGTNNLKKNCKN